MPARTGVVADPGCLAHDMGRHHAETPKRLQVLLDLLTTSDARSLGVVLLEGRQASQAEVTAVHGEAWYRRLKSTEGRTVALDLDTTAGPRSFDAALRAAGCSVTAVQSVLSGQVRNAFALVRPPGHHAETDRGGGFCLFNNAAIAARHARTAGGLERVAVVDFDLHHGNGTQQIFWDDPGVLFVSTHQAPLYPGTGRFDDLGGGEARGTTVNIPLAAGHGDAEFEAIYGGLVSRVLDQYAPEMIIVSAGFDLFVGDPLGGMEVTAEGFAKIAGHLKSAADRLCDGRLVMVLEGGYSLAGLRDGTMACLSAMSSARSLAPLKGPIEDLPLGDALRHLPVWREFYDL